ncbi:MAG TPA: protein EcsC, partial [Citreicella sp.]|nr:protein EcsC [Citreicella sp.]
MAHVQFGLRRLSQDSGRPREELVAQLRQRLLQR